MSPTPETAEFQLAAYLEQVPAGARVRALTLAERLKPDGSPLPMALELALFTFLLSALFLSMSTQKSFWLILALIRVIGDPLVLGASNEEPAVDPATATVR